MSLIEQFDEQHAKLLALEAAEAELLLGPDEALSVLGPLTDPIRVKAALGILLRAGRHRVAADLIRGQRPDERWMSLAVVAFAFLGEIERATAIVAYADNSRDVSVMRSTRLGFAEGVVDAWHNRRAGDSLLAPEPWPEDDVRLAKQVIEVLDPLLSSVRASRRITGDYELSAVVSAGFCAWIARDRELLSQYSQWLLTYVPVPLIVAEMSLRGLTQAPVEGLPNRLRVEHTGNFHAALLAAMIERDILKRPEDAFDALVALSSSKHTEEERDALCVALFETCGRCGSAQIHQATEVVKRLRPEGSRLLTILNVLESLAHGDTETARERLEAVRDEGDGVWWQAHAQLSEQLGDDEAAQAAWERASELIPHPDVLRRSVKASIDRRRYQSAIRPLQKLLESEPDNVQHLRALAWAYTQLNDHSHASIHLERLVELLPDELEYRLSLAQSLARTARTPEAIKVLIPACEGEEPSVDAILLQSELLGADGRAIEAFEILEAIAADHWDDPRFLLRYMQRAHAAGRDKLAHEAFARMLELRREGKVAPDLMQEKTLEELLEYGKSFQSRRETLQQALIAGRMTWLFAEEMLGNTPVWAWTLHTQELKWLSEEPLTRAAFSVYSTNSFFVGITPAGAQFQRIHAPPPGTHVVADISALLTLHKLRMLEKAAAYFGRISLPASYGDRQVVDSHRLGQHQPSREKQLLIIRSYVDRNRIRVEPHHGEDAIILDEYADDGLPHKYRLQDLVALLRTTQRAEPSALLELQQVAHKPPGADSAHPRLALGDEIVISLLTLRTLAEQRVFGEIVDAVSILLKKNEYDEMIAELRAHETAHEARSFHDSLWHVVAELATKGVVAWEGLSTQNNSTDETESDIDDVVYLDAVHLAQRLKLPLLADDRVLQVLCQHDTASGPLAVFGSDSLVEGMLESGACEAHAAAQAFRQLLNWRYRFLIPSDDVLHAWAVESVDNLPGPALIDAAFYLHDSLRDAGLHCGPEQSDPPTPMAVQFVMGWIRTAVSFLYKLWTDERFSDEACSLLTMWAAEELIPSCPRGLWYQEVADRLTREIGPATLSMAMVQFTGIHNPDRANRALRTLAAALGIDDDRYCAVAARAFRASINSERRLHSEKHTEERIFDRMMLQNALLHVGNGRLTALAFARFRALGFFDDVVPPGLPDQLIEAMREAAHSPVAHESRGPLILLRGSDSASVVDAESILFHPKKELRAAAYDYLRAVERAVTPWLTPHTFTVLKNAETDISSEDDARWRNAAIEVASAVREDLLGALAGLRQSLAWHYHEGIDEYLNLVVYPRFESLVHFRPTVWNPVEQMQEIRGWITELSRHPVLADALTAYLDRCGYVPLSQDLSSSKLVVSWLAEHPGEKVDWMTVWGWATQLGGLLAQYHAITIALNVPEVRPTGELEEFWPEVMKILSVGQVPEQTEFFDVRWELFCELGSHFARHLESVHPAQHGDAVACYAWWLAYQLVQVLGANQHTAEWSLKELIAPRQRLSYFRWTAARSPVVPTDMRYATLHVNSVWAISLLANMSSTASTFREPRIPHALQETIANTLHGYVIVGPLARASEGTVRCFAVQENDEIVNLCNIEGYLPSEMRERIAALISLRREIAAPDQAEDYLEQLNELPVHVQHLCALALRDFVWSSTSHDAELVKWLERSNGFTALLTGADTAVVETILDVLSEFQQHQVGDWAMRLPHLVAHAFDGVQDEERAQLLATHVMQQTVNGGSGSALQRLATSQKWHLLVEPIERWRANLLDRAKHSEPWVASRVRSVSATISRLIGPHRRHPGHQGVGANEKGGETEAAPQT